MNFINNKNIKDEFRKFYKIYKNRPIIDNENGVKIEHAFYLYIVLNKLKPKLVIESGVYAGQSTWLIEKFSNNAKILCFDINLNNLVYKSKKAKYFEFDLSDYNWKNINKEKTLIFFDDHISFYDRLEFSKENKFRHLIFDDNYPVNIGDCYSFKKILAGKDQRYYLYEYFNNYFLARIKFFIKNLIGIKRFYGNKKIKFEHNKIKIYDPKKFIRYEKKFKTSFSNNKEFYFEFPPLLKFDPIKRWQKYKYLKNKDFKTIKVKKPVFDYNFLEKVIDKKEDLNEFSKQYNFFCYYKIKNF